MSNSLHGIGRTLPHSVKAAVTLARSAMWLARTRGHQECSGLRILLYHRISDDNDPLALSPRRFRDQMAYLQDEGYRVVDLMEALELLRRRALVGRAVVLTFDDGFADVAEEALPVLERHGFPATVFVTTGVTGGRVAFPWYDGRQPRVLGWDEVIDLDGRGTLRFEAHTVSHPSLLAVDDAAAATEIGESRRELAQRLGRPVSAFAYPAGLYGERERRFVAEAGYTAALSCEPGVNRPDSDPLALCRRQIDSHDRLLDFKAKLGGGHDTPLPLRSTYRRLRFGMPESSRA
ncbi:MAG: polysaccharide deacetylase family protein [Solirubrobacteraceae bacterium]